MVITETHVLFYGEDDLFSNHNRTCFCYNGMYFNTIEKAFQWEKAIHAGDAACANSILETDDPKEAMYLGKRVLKGYNDANWSSIRLSVMCGIAYARYSQDMVAYNTLIAHRSAGRSFAEAARKNHLWGIGLGKQEAKNTEPSEWPGEGLMTAVLCRTADRLIRENSWLQQGFGLQTLFDVQKNLKELRDGDE